MKRSIYDGGLQPVDRTAARVAGKGEHYESKKKITQRHWDVPPPMRQVSPKDLIDNLIGIKFGRLTVLGLYTEASGLWVVRCACGDYETRRTKSIKNPNNDQDRCENCRETVHLRRQAEFLATGKNKRQSFGDD